MDGRVYKVYGIVTNIFEIEASELVLPHHGRCGKSEEIHRILKDDLAGGHVISKRSGVNATYWNIAVLAIKKLISTIFRASTHSCPRPLNQSLSNLRISGLAFGAQAVDHKLLPGNLIPFRHFQPL